MGVEEVEVGTEGLEPADRGRVLDPRSLDHPAARAAGGLTAVRGAFVAVELQQRQADPVRGQRDLVEGGVHEHTDDLGLSPELGADRRSLVGLAGPRTAGPEDEANRPGTGLSGQARVLDRGYAANLDSGHSAMVAGGPGAARSRRRA